MAISAENGCGKPATATGELDFGATDHLSLRSNLALAVAGTRVLSFQVASGAYLGGSVRWHRMRLVRFRGVELAEAPARFADDGSASFRISLMATRSAGIGSCYETSPDVFEYPGADTTEWDEANNEGEIYFQDPARSPRPRLDYAPLSDAIMRMSVRGESPDRGSLDAGGIVASNIVQLTCTGGVPLPTAADRGDAFYYERALVAESNCSSVQTFQAGNAATDLNLRVFAAGILLSAAIAMLLEALATGRTAEETRPRESSAGPRPRI